MEAHIEREIATRPELIQIENGWRSPKEQKPGAVQRGHFREIDAAPENPDAEPVPPCAASKPAIVVYGKRVGTTITVCTDNNCLVHDPRAAARHAAMQNQSNETPEPEGMTEPDSAIYNEERSAEEKQQRQERQQEQECREEERREDFQRQQEEYEAERNRRAELLNARVTTFNRILDNAPAMFTTAQLRVFLRALISLDPYTFADDVAKHLAGDDDNDQRTAEEILLSTIDGLPDDKLTGFALRLALTGHTDIPREGEFDFLTEAEIAFLIPPAKTVKTKAEKKPTPTKKPQKKATAKKKIAA